ncbi:regulator of chromosome condensation 1/beta-lactamase-inhibitor protein II [Cladorrhinum samala]|uniref:Regulator of chromosome condensation 1/beta-lactamase-inhibitor protein II n=1 Tax=Cladorrhinum samala TaxID=585594 RepID=A0AAV9HA66_9PEZI|nr:regulator of chromosome condensation 1/beta-lactamase-inhibitor protein II [Cladorrhinum samala]
MTITLFSLGSNGSGQLSLSHIEDVSTPQPVTSLPHNLTSPISISCGGNHTILISSSNTLSFITGSLPPSPAPTTSFVPLSLPSPFTPTSSSCAWTTTHLAAPQALFSFGHGPKGELGLGPSMLSTGVPTQLPNFPPPHTNIISLSSSMSHTVVLLSTGQVYAFGAGRKGQIGLPAVPAVYEPRLINEVPFRVEKTLCGKEFTCLLGGPATGDILILGSDKFGIKSQAPSNVKGWKDAGAGWGSIFILFEDGSMKSWGRDDHGQMVPEELGKVKTMAVGSEHVVAVLEETGNVVAWGWGEHGNCGPEGLGEKGDGKSFGVHNIYEVQEFEEVVMVGAGCATSWIAIERKGG